MKKYLKDPKPMTVLKPNGGNFEFTPKTEVGLAWVEMRNASVKRGDRFYSSDELERAWDFERAGYDGLGMICRNEDVTLTQT